MKKLQYVDMSYYILRKDGATPECACGAARPNHPRRFAVHDGEGKRYETAVALFQGTVARLAAHAGKDTSGAGAEEIDGYTSSLVIALPRLPVCRNLRPC